MITPLIDLTSDVHVATGLLQLIESGKRSGNRGRFLHGCWRGIKAPKGHDGEFSPETPHMQVKFRWVGTKLFIDYAQLNYATSISGGIPA